MAKREVTPAQPDWKAVLTSDEDGFRALLQTVVQEVLELLVPQDRAGRFSTELFERYQCSEKALVAALAAMYVQGVSTRKVKAVSEELCGHGFSCSAISGAAR